jgi:hypothetical protein
MVSFPALACIKISDNVRAWTQCAYKVAHERGDQKFMVNFATAKATGQKVLSTAQPRWNSIEKRIVARCGSFEKAAAADKRAGSKDFRIPTDQFDAIVDTADIGKLVKSNA